MRQGRKKIYRSKRKIEIERKTRRKGIKVRKRERNKERKGEIEKGRNKEREK